MLNDDNAFLKNFVNHELLATLGFIVSITLASTAHIHLELNRIGERNNISFVRTKVRLKLSAFSLVWLLGISILIVVIKPTLPYERYSYAIINSLAIIIMFFNLSVLYDITKTVFGIPSDDQIRKNRQGPYT